MPPSPDQRENDSGPLELLKQFYEADPVKSDEEQALTKKLDEVLPCHTLSDEEEVRTLKQRVLGAVTALLLFFTLGSCQGPGGAVRDYFNVMADKVCEVHHGTVDDATGVRSPSAIVGAIDQYGGMVLPQPLLAPLAGVIDLGLTAVCETTGLGIKLAGSAVGVVVDPVGTVMEVTTSTMNTVTGNSGAPATEPAEDPDGS